MIDDGQSICITRGEKQIFDIRFIFIIVTVIREIIDLFSFLKIIKMINCLSFLKIKNDLRYNIIVQLFQEKRKRSVVTLAIYYAFKYLSLIA